jgi:hypothetical protein
MNKLLVDISSETVAKILKPGPSKTAWLSERRSNTALGATHWRDKPKVTPLRGTRRFCALKERCFSCEAALGSNSQDAQAPHPLQYAVLITSSS